MVASAGPGVYSVGMHPVVNIDEKIGKTVGRRRAGDPLLVAAGDKARKRDMQKAGFFPRFPKGVFKFRSFAEPFGAAQGSGRFVFPARVVRGRGAETAG